MAEYQQLKLKLMTMFMIAGMEMNKLFLTSFKVR